MRSYSTFRSEPFTVIQFSYPSSLVNVIEGFTDDRVMSNCRSLFTSRLQRISVPWLHDARIDTTIYTKTFDRVAL